MKVSRIALLIAVSGVVTGCGSSEPVRIGYVAAITGRHSQLGIDGRNGVEMAIRERNDKGGVAGRAIELVIRDDESDPDVGVAVLNELTREARVDAVIGPLTSNMLPAVQGVHDAGVLIFSPIMSTVQLSGLDDHFVRANLSVAHQAGVLAEKMIRDGIYRTSVVYDVSNPQYTREFTVHFQSEIQKRGGTVTLSLPLNSAADPDYVGIADEIVEDQAPAVVFVTTGIDAGVLAQQLWKRNVEIAMYAAEWAKTSDIISVGGRAVNGMVIATQFFPDNPPEKYTQFSQRYQSMYGSAPNFAAQYAYETAVILLDAIERAGTAQLDELKRHIVGHTHEGLVEQIVIDANGDTIRTPAIAKIQNGRFLIETLELDSK